MILIKVFFTSCTSLQHVNIQKNSLATETSEPSLTDVVACYTFVNDSTYTTCFLGFFEFSTFLKVISSLLTLMDGYTQLRMSSSALTGPFALNCSGQAEIALIGPKIPSPSLQSPQRLHLSFRLVIHHFVIHS